jgi:putative MATE family efflux protein
LTDQIKTAPRSQARFITGSTMSHVVVMTLTSSVGLMTLFLVDFADMYFLSLLGQAELAAAVGYAGSILFFTTSICIGMAIAVGALCARAIGAGNPRHARGYAVNTCLFAAVVSALIAGLIWWYTPECLSLLGAKGRTHDLAVGYLRIIVPTMPLLALGMCCMAVLRAAGDARRAMYVTLAGGAVNAVLDPILIFGLDMGIDGAAWASVAARIAVVLTGFYGAHVVHRLIGRFRPDRFAADLGDIARIAVPAMATNIATPIGNAYVTAAVAQFGDGPVAGLAIIMRVMPVAFGILFSLSGAIGPIIGQNFGAENFDRVRRGFLDALIFTAVFVAAVMVLVFAAQGLIISLFSATGEAASLIAFFCTWLTIGFLFNGALYVSNAAFNNLGRPELSTIFNWAKNTIGTMLPAWLGGLWFGAVGVLTGQVLGAVVFGIAAVIAVLMKIRNLDEAQAARARQALPRRGWWRNPVNKGQDL